jgi:hypothetical protein
MPQLPCHSDSDNKHTVLDLDFDHTTPRLLQRISAAAPALAVLRLRESLFTVEVCHSFCTQVIV